MFDVLFSPCCLILNVQSSREQERRRLKYGGGCIKDDGEDQSGWNARLRSRAAVAFFISWLQVIVLEVAVDTSRVSLLVRRT